MPHVQMGSVALEVKSLSVERKVRDVSFALRHGEIVGMTGLLGAGQNEVARALFGVQTGASGVIVRDGRPVIIGSPADAIAAGICLLTENRKHEGLIADMSVKENMTLPSLAKFRRGGIFVDHAREGQATRAFVDKLNIAVSSPAAQVRTLSGGNQQKTILARWLLRDLNVLIFIEPTRGIDVGAKAEIYHDLDRLARSGKAILIVSPELPEILGVSDRIFVMYGGCLTHTFERDDVDEEALLAAVQGGDAHDR